MICRNTSALAGRRGRRGLAISGGVVAKAAFVLINAALAASTGRSTGKAVKTYRNLRDLPKQIQTEMHINNKAALDGNLITRAQYEVHKHKINSYGEELKAIGSRLRDEQSGRAKKHLIKATADVGTTIVTAGKWKDAALKHFTGTLLSGGEGIATSRWAGKPTVEVSDVMEAIRPMRDKWKAPEDAFVRACVAARVRAFIDHVRTLKVSRERRRDWIVNFTDRIEREGWGKLLPGVEGRQDLREYLANEVRKYFAADKALENAGIDKSNKDYREIRKRLLDEMAEWHASEVKAEDLQRRLARIREEVRRGIQPKPKDPPPVAAITCSKYAGKAPLEVRLIGSGSKGKNLSYSWSGKDLGIRSGALVQHKYIKPGRYLVKLIVTDKAARTSVARKRITVFTGLPVRVSVEEVKCIPKGTIVGEKVKIAVTIKLDGLLEGVTAATRLSIGVLGQKLQADMGNLASGAPTRTVEFKIPEDAKIGPQSVGVTAQVTPPDEELYAHTRNQLSHTKAGTLFVRDPFLGLWKGKVYTTRTYPVRRDAPPVDVQVQVQRRGRNTLVLKHSGTTKPLIATIRNRTATGTFKEPLLEEKGTFVFKGERMTSTSTYVRYVRDPDTGKRKVDTRGRVRFELRRVWHPGEPTLRN